MKRDGKTLAKLQPGDRRRLADMKNGWRHASFEQRIEFLDFVQEGAEEEDTAEGIAREWSEPE